MSLTIPDEILKETGLTEQEARVEIACLLFDAEKLDLWPAAQMARLSRVEMEAELLKRGIAIYRPTVEDLEEDLKGLEALRAAKDVNRRQ